MEPTRLTYFMSEIVFIKLIFPESSASHTPFQLSLEPSLPQKLQHYYSDLVTSSRKRNSCMKNTFYILGGIAEPLYPRLQLRELLKIFVYFIITIKAFSQMATLNSFQHRHISEILQACGKKTCNRGTILRRQVTCSQQHWFSLAFQNNTDVMVMLYHRPWSVQ